MGDWSMGQSSAIKGISTPNITLKRKLKEYMTVFSIDEFRTSKLHHKTEEECDNLYLPDKKGIMRKKHSILTFQTKYNRMGCINRDNNAVNNMLKIVNSFLTDGTRPVRYRREQEKKSETKKRRQPTVLSNVSSSIS